MSHNDMENAINNPEFGLAMTRAVQYFGPASLTAYIDDSSLFASVWHTAAKYELVENISPVPFLTLHLEHTVRLHCRSSEAFSESTSVPGDLCLTPRATLTANAKPSLPPSRTPNENQTINALMNASDTADAAQAFYDRMADESHAMQDYFHLLTQDDAALDGVLARFRASPERVRFADLTNAATLRRQIAADYLNVGGSIGNMLALAGPQAGTVRGYGLSVPAARQRTNRDGSLTPSMEDRPFNTHNSGRPDGGYMNIRREIVVALTTAGMRWGASEMGGASGDIMHFDCADDGRS